MRVRQEDLCKRDRGAHSTEALCRDNDFSVVTDLSSYQKKKKKNLTPRFGVSQIVSVPLLDNGVAYFDVHMSTPTY